MDAQTGAGDGGSLVDVGTAWKALPADVQERLGSILSMGKHFGVHGLAKVGLCELRGPDAYPHMRQWLQPVVTRCPRTPTGLLYVGSTRADESWQMTRISTNL